MIFGDSLYFLWTDTGNNGADVIQYWEKRKFLQKNMWVQNWLRREIQAILQVCDSNQLGIFDM